MGIRDLPYHLKALLAIRSPYMQGILNETYGTSNKFTQSPVHEVRQKGTTRVVRPYTELTKGEFDRLVAEVSTSTELSEGQRRAELKRLREISPYKHRNKPFLGELLERPSMKYNSNPSAGFFDMSHIRRDTLQDLQTYVALDIETDDFRRPLSISAVKFRFNRDTGKFENVDNYQRFYSTDWRSITTTYATHKLSPAELKSLRKQQGAQYSSVYNEEELELLRKYLGASVIVGHNVASFDLPVLFHGQPIQNSTIDTLHAAMNVWKKGERNKLDAVFQRVFGKTMEEAGLSHHDANADTIASMMILQEMVKWQGPVGSSIKYIMQHPWQHQLATPDDYFDEFEQIIKGTYLDALGRRGAYRMTAKELGFKDGEGVLQWGITLKDLEDVKGEQLTESDAKIVASAWKEAKAFEKGKVALASDAYTGLSQMFNSFNFWKKSALVQQMAKAKSDEEMNALVRTTFQAEGEMGDVGTLKMLAENLRSARERNKQTEFEETREHRIERLRKKYGKWVDDGDEKAIRATKSFDELNDVLDDTTTRVDRMISVFAAFANIKPYDINQYLHSAKHQWGATVGAARGVVPSFLLDPISRLGDAAFNYKEGRLAPWNAFNRTWNATAGQVGNASMSIGISTGNPWAIGIGGFLGGINTVSQIVGNYKQGQMEQTMLGIQNTLNTLGAITSWITTPFKLLHRATKMLIGSFSGLTFSINNFMKNGIGEMSQMGNPLSELTGVNYAAYEGTTMMDVASLFNKGSMNSIYEDFAKQQRAFYTMGQVNQGRLIASSLLGVYSDVYNPSTDTEATYNNMVNKLLTDMKYQSPDQQARTMYLASQIDNNLPGLLRTANMLGVTDVNQLTNPRSRGMYWNPLSDSQEQQYRWTQYEYGAATQQWGRSKMKIANILWQSFGKDIYNGVNGVVDQLTEGNWKGALEQAKEMWYNFRDEVSKIWKSITGEGEGGKSSGGWGHAFKALGLQIANIALDVGETIINIWDRIMLHLVDKAEGLISYLSTVSMTPHYNWKTGEVSFEFNSIGTAKANHGEIYSIDSVSGEAYVNKGMEGYAALADIIYGKGVSPSKWGLTDEQLYWDVGKYLMAGNTLDLSEYGYKVSGAFHGEEVKALIAALGKAGLKDSPLWKVAAWQEANGVPQDWKIANFDDTSGIFAGFSDLMEQKDVIQTEVLNNIRGAINDKIQIELKLVDDKGRTKATLLFDNMKNGVTKAVTKLQDLVPGFTGNMYNLEVQNLRME